MTKPSLSWQSWSPTSLSLLRIPQWDYCPIPTSLPTTFQKPTYLPKPPISLWCSWQSNGTKICEDLIFSQAKKFQRHKYVPQYILIDDGWCLWGDWNTPNKSKFPHSIKSVVDNLTNLKYQTGLWIAPFLADPRSNLVKSHPDWLLKSRYGHPYNAFMSYPLVRNFTPKYLLDFTNPSVMDYLLDSINTMVDKWDISLLKLDHLYAPYFAPNHQIARQASSALTKLFEYIRYKHSNVYTIACGCPFSDAQNHVDAIRLSKDINSPQLQNIPLLGRFLYQKRKFLLDQKLELASQLSPLPFGLDPDSAMNKVDADKYYTLWKSGKIQVFGLGYNL